MYFVDYGNSEVVPVHVLRKLPAELVDIPALAVECMLREVISTYVFMHTLPISFVSTLLSFSYISSPLLTQIRPKDAVTWSAEAT